MEYFVRVPSPIGLVKDEMWEDELERYKLSQERYNGVKITTDVLPRVGEDVTLGEGDEEFSGRVRKIEHIVTKDVTGNLRTKRIEVNITPYD